MRLDVVVPAAVTVVFWSSAFVGIRIGLGAFSPLHLTLLRFLTASVAFGVYAVVTRMPLPRRQDMPRLFGLAFIGITLYHSALNIGQQSVSPTTASLIIAIAPVFTAGISFFVLGERLSGWGWLGMIVSLSGVGIMVGLGDSGIELTRGAASVLLSSLCGATFFVLQKPFLQAYRPVHLNAYVTWLGTLPLLLAAGGLGDALAMAPMRSILAVVYLGLFPAALAYVTWSMTLSHMHASKASSLLYLNPPLSMVFSYLFLGEAPLSQELMGGSLALIGVVMVNTRGKGTRRVA
ncbi:MAG: DMT family transporter [Limnochordia bacterium]|jgi:drug/metabolite transporter (DMT)-like permease